MQKLKRAIKKVAAFSSGALMLGATALGAVAAADLADYPSPFVADGTWSGLIVVGTGGTNPAGLASDIAGAVDIAARLAQEATTATGTTTTVTGGETEDVILGTAIAVSGGDTHQMKEVLKDTDVAGLLDSSLSWDDGTGSATYDYEERIKLGTTNLKVQISAGAGDNDYGSDPVIQIGKDDLQYYFVFTDTINMTAISSSNYVAIPFLGQDIKITSTSTSGLTAEIGTEYYMTVGDSVEVNEKTVTLKDVASSGYDCVVDVDGVTKVIDNTASTVNTVKFDVQSTFYSDAKADRSATILIGTETTKTYSDGDPYIGQDKNDPDWVWDITGIITNGTKSATTIGSVNSIGIEFDQTYNDANDPVLAVGDCLKSPNSYFSICFDSLSQNDWIDYTFEIDVSTDLSEAGAGWTALTGEKTVYITTTDEEGIKSVGQNENTNKIWLWANGTDGIDVFYEDAENHVAFDAYYAASDNVTPKFVDFIYKDTNLDIVWNPESHTLTSNHSRIEIQDYDGNLTIVFETDSSGDFVNTGAIASQSEAGELMYEGTNVGTADNDLMTEYGIIIKDPDSNGANDEVMIQVPGDQVYANVAIKGSGTTTTASGGAVTINSIAGVPLVKLDTEVTDKTSKPLILLGGPAVNKLSAEALGVAYPSYGAASTVPENKALIKLVNNAFGGTNVALVVAGWEASNTREAANVLKDFGSYDLSGTAVEVSGTSVTAVASTTTTA